MAALLLILTGIISMILSYRNRVFWELSVYSVLISYVDLAYSFPLPASLCLLMSSTIVGENTSGNLKTLIQSMVRRSNIYLAKFVSHVGFILFLDFSIFLILYGILFLGFGLHASPVELKLVSIKIFYYNIYIVTLSALLLAASMSFKTSMNAMVSLFVAITFIKTVTSNQYLKTYFSPFLRTWSKAGLHQTREFIWLTLSVYSLLIVVFIVFGLYRFSRYRVLS